MPDDDHQRRRAARWGLVRLALGIVQTVGAVATLFALVETGASDGTVAIGVATGAAAMVSILLFRILRADGGLTSGRRVP